MPNPAPAPDRSAERPRILVIRRRYLGDIVLLGSVFRNLKLHWPAASIDVLTEPAYTPILTLNSDVAALALPARLTAWPAFLRQIRAARYTHVLDFDNTEKTALVTRASGAPLRATYDRETNRVRAAWAYTAFARVTDAFYTTHHITDTYLALLAPVGVPVVSHDVALTPRPADLAFVQHLVGARSPAGGPRRVLLHPGSRSRYRVWPAERFAVVCDRLQDELDLPVYVVAGPHEQPLVRELRRHAKMHLVAIEQNLTIPQFAALLSQFDLLLCHDSGPMHVAAAVGTPVVALFGSQNTTMWRPLGAQHILLQTPLPCACLGPAAPTPCIRGDSYHSYCVRKLETDEVFAAVKTALIRRADAS